MTKNTRDTIRRPKDHEMDPQWESDDRELMGDVEKEPKPKTIDKEARIEREDEEGM